MPTHIVKAALGPAVAVSLLLVACAAPPDVGSAGREPASPPSDQSMGRFEDRCGEVAEAIGDAEPGAAVEPLQQIGELLAGSSEGEELRREIDRLSAALAEGRGDELTEEHLAATLPALVELGGRLVSLGATNCVSIQEAASVHLPPPPSDPGDVGASAEEHRGLWQSQGIETYHFGLSVHMEEGRETEPPCGVFGWLLVQVVDGHPELAVDRFSGCRVDPEQAKRSGPPLTVELIFDLVITRSDAAQVQVDYDPALGYPRTVFVQSDGGVLDLSIQDFGIGHADLSGPEAVLDELEAARRQWVEQGIDDYAFTVEVGCFCPPEFRGPFEVTVVDGEITQAALEGKPIGEGVDRRFLTIEGLFGSVERHAYADSIEVTYHPELGYPKVIDVDPLRKAIDEELQVVVMELTLP